MTSMNKMKCGVWTSLLKARDSSITLKFYARFQLHVRRMSVCVCMWFSKLLRLAVCNCV